MVVLSGLIQFRDGFREEGLRACEAMLAPSRAEEGCISYRFFEDPMNPGTIHFFEEWRSQEDLDAHFRMPYFENFGRQLGEMASGQPKIRTYDVTRVHDL